MKKTMALLTMILTLLAFSACGSNGNNNNASPDSSNLKPKDYIINYYGSEYDVIQTTFSTEYWKMPFAKEDDGTFTREGSVLLGYSFDEEGKGELIRPGYKYNLPNEDDNQDLYCVWAKETNADDFVTVQKRTSTVYITAYNGSDEVVYIPREINGKTVTGIAANAFADNSSIKEVHITPSIEEIEENAFASCKNLKTVTMYDNLKKVSDASFNGTDVKTVRMCAAITPRYITSQETYGIKYERLINTKGQKRIIVLAGSSVLYGIDSAYMETLFKDEYTCINFGTNANMNVLFYLDAIIPHLTKKDIVVFSPEQYGPYTYFTNGNPELPSVTLQGVSTCYNLFENVDVSDYTKVFDGIGEFCEQASKMPSKTWESYGKDLDELGNLIGVPTEMNKDDFIFGKNGPFRFNETVIPEEYIPNLNRVIDKVKETKATILFSYPPHNKNNIEKTSLNKESYKSYNKWIAKTVHCPLISDVTDYIYEGKYFANTDYHLNTTGRQMHTKQVAEDIKNADLGVR